MSRFEEVKKLADEKYETISNKENREICFHHHQKVSECAKKIAEIKKHDPELVEIAAYLHDIAQYLEKGHHHAYRSSILARDILLETQLFTTDEIQRIMNTIARHSDKDRIDLPCDEILKEADILAKVLDGETTSYDEKVKAYL